MLQIDHIYEFLYENLFKDFEFGYLLSGVPKTNNISFADISIFKQKDVMPRKIFFYDQEPYISQLADPYMQLVNLDDRPGILVTSEYSKELPTKLIPLYYFFHGFAALDWYRGYYALNYNKPIVKQYRKDFISFNRIITNDRSYRIYFISLLKEHGLLPHGLVSFGVADDIADTWHDETSDPSSKLSDRAKLHAETHLVDVNKLVIDNPNIHGSASADIPRTIDRIDYNNDTLNVDALWNVVTETVFYYNKLHLTEKIFKPIVSKQPFMLLAAPGNLAYLKSYGFKTFEGIIDESYDIILDSDLRTEAVVKQLQWYCRLSDREKDDVIHAVEPIVSYNFHHFYGEFKHIITQELLDNTKTVFNEIGHNYSHINFNNIYHVLTQ
jgi:hypothetical protein